MRTQPYCALSPIAQSTLQAATSPEALSTQNKGFKAVHAALIATRLNYEGRCSGAHYGRGQAAGGRARRGQNFQALDRDAHFGQHGLAQKPPKAGQESKSRQLIELTA